MEKLSLREILFNNQDLKYKKFNDKIINTKMETIGVRIPIIKNIAKNIYKNDSNFFENYCAIYFEEVLAEAIFISCIKDIDVLLEKLNCFLDKIDNWAVCDTLCSSLKIIKKYKEKVFTFIVNCLKSNNPWRVRFGFVLLLNYYIEKDYLEIIFNKVEKDKNEFYYVMMAKAWLISMCYIKFPKETYLFLLKNNIDCITYNKAISKICDSYRVSKEDKITLRKMKKLSKNA